MNINQASYGTFVVACPCGEFGFRTWRQLTAWLEGHGFCGQGLEEEHRQYFCHNCKIYLGPLAAANHLAETLQQDGISHHVGPSSGNPTPMQGPLEKPAVEAIFLNPEAAERSNRSRSENREDN